MSDKTEQPTPKRLREAREKGDVCKSQDIATAIVVLALGAYFLSMGGSILKTVMDMTEIPFSLMSVPFETAAPKAAAGIFDASVKVVLPILALVMAVALLSNLAQVGVLFSLKAAMPKLENLSPSKWFKKVFSVKNLVDFAKNCIKVGALGWVVWSVIEDNIRNLFAVRHGTIWSLWTLVGDAVIHLILMAAGMFCVIAALDFLYQKWQYGKEHMMSKDEVKREYKEMEGDPYIKGKRKQLHRELIAQGAMDNVRKAKVLVTNPTHYAVALDYDKDTTPLPIILAKGEGELARRMIAVAQEEGIPIMRNVSLARNLFENGTENAYIPQDLIRPVAEVLRWVQSLKQN